MKSLRYASLLCVACGMTSCATVFCGSKKMVTFDSNLTSESATLTVDGRKYTNVKFPYSMKVKRGFNDTVVKAEADGYAPVMLVIEKTFNAVSVINLGNVLAWGIDAATGAMMKPEFDYYQIDFEKEAPGK